MVLLLIIHVHDTCNYSYLIMEPELDAVNP